MGSLEDKKSWFDTIHGLWKLFLETLMWFWEDESAHLEALSLTLV